jgi:hypothetical protein
MADENSNVMGGIQTEKADGKTETTNKNVKVNPY